ncbi:MAG: type II secretion system protein GspN [Bdellovibrionaceae bacterium]|nr:type II secretion system protein GspN [Pseudobdellovibrionaceae bacterium]
MEDLRTYILQPIINVFKFHKFKIFLVFFFTLIFIVVMFPYREISEIISNQISKATRNQVQMSFEDIGLSLYPFGISAKNVYIATPNLTTPLFVQRVYITPSILSLLSLKPGGSFRAENIWGGNITATLTHQGQGHSNNKDSKVARIELALDKIDVGEVLNWMQAPAKLSGKISGKSDLRLDLMALDHPRGSFNFSGTNVELPSVISMQGMDLMLPEGQFKRLALVGQLQNGKMNLTEGALGQPNDVIYGKVKGQMDLTTRKMGASITFVPGPYDFNFDLNFNKDAESKLGTMIGTVLLNNKGGRSATLDGGARYIFSLSGYPRGVPSFQPLNQF